MNLAKRFLLLLALAAVLAVLFPRSAGASVSFEFFYENLNPYGEWIDTDDYGPCWRPSGMDAEWAPYTDGYWAYTDAGWTWVSYEDFGSVTYHYGRWVRIDGYGWIWKPDYEWAPAWVSWRYSDDYVGWAPLPPEARWDIGLGISFSIDRDCDIGPGYYSFCETRHFGSPVLRNVLVRRSENVRIIHKTVNITNISYDRDKRVIHNGGPDYRRISDRSQRRIETLRLERRSDWDRRGGKLPPAQRVGQGLVVVAPEIKKSGNPVPPPGVKRRVGKAKVDRGWNHIADTGERRRVAEKMRGESEGRSREKASARSADSKAFEEAFAARAKERPQEAPRRESVPRNESRPEPRRDSGSRNRGPETRREEQRPDQPVRPERSDREQADRASRERQQKQRRESEAREQRERNERNDRERREREQQQRQRERERERERENARAQERNREREVQRSREQEFRRQEERRRDDSREKRDNREKRENRPDRREGDRRKEERSSKGNDSKGKEKKRDGR